MKLFLAVICVFLYFAQLCSGLNSVEEEKEYCDKHRNEILTENEISENTKLFESIKGISTQALDDFKTINKEHCIIYRILIAFANSLLRGYEARDKLLDADYIHLMLKMVGALPWEMELLNEEAAKIPADKLDSDIKARVMKMLNGFARGSSLENVMASLDYLYGRQSNTTN